MDVESMAWDTGVSKPLSQLQQGEWLSAVTCRITVEFGRVWLGGINPLNHRTDVHGREWMGVEQSLPLPVRWGSEMLLRMGVNGIES